MGLDLSNEWDAQSFPFQYTCDMDSFVEVPAGYHFPIQNLPFGVFSDRHNKGSRVGVAIGEMVLDLAVLEERSLFIGPNCAEEESSTDRP